MTTIDPKNAYERNNVKLAKSITLRGDKSIYTYFEIPDAARPTEGFEKGHTHVKVYTMKFRNGMVACSSRGVTIKDSSESFMLYGKDKFEANLYGEMGRATEKTLIRVHNSGIAAFTNAFPQLFVAPTVSDPGTFEGPQRLAEDFAPEPTREDRESLEDDQDDAGRFVPQAVTAPFVEGGMNWRPLLTIMLLLTMALGARAQTITRDANGNFTEVERLHVEHDSTTAYTFTYQREGRSFTIPVYQGPKGGLYVWMPTEKGTPFRRYLPKQ